MKLPHWVQWQSLSLVCVKSFITAITPIRVTFPAHLNIPPIILIIPTTFANNTNYKEPHYYTFPTLLLPPLSQHWTVLDLIIRIPFARWARTLPLGIRYQQSLWTSIGCTVERDRGMAGSLAHRSRQQQTARNVSRHDSLISMDLPVHWFGKSDELEATVQANRIDIHVDSCICNDLSNMFGLKS